MSYRNEENEEVEPTGPLSFYQKVKARWSLWKPSPAFALKVVTLSGIVFLFYYLFQIESIIYWFCIFENIFKIIGALGIVISFLTSLHCFMDAKYGEDDEDLGLFSLYSAYAFILSLLLLYFGFVVFESKHLEVVERQERLYAPYENAMQEIDPDYNKESCE